jgi:hypothetical protein
MVVTKGIVSFAFFACCVSACGVLESASTADPNTGEATEAASTADVCWKRTTVRGLGAIPSECPNADKSGALCYPRCPAGYAGVGPVCWQSCPDGYHDDGALCRRDAQLQSADTSGCPWYDKCGLTLAKGCSKCPAGFANDGCTCRKDVHIFAKTSQTRGVGWPMSCRDGHVNDAGLCYPRCDGTMSGVGPVCWARCGGDMPVECGAGCARSQEACAQAISDQVLKTAETVVSAVQKDWGDAIANGLAAANAFRLPICGVQ